MKMLVGLGNPGPQYELTRHNVGFLVIDALADKVGVSSFKQQAGALVASVNYQGEKLLLVKPQTYMNLSGQAVGELARYYKIPAQDVLVIYDDMDNPFGQLRLRARGSSGGHNGIKSIISHLGTEEFPRLKVGIGRPRSGQSAADYVLEPFSSEERAALGRIIPAAVDRVLAVVDKGIVAAMNEFNGKRVC
ncbi:aminoacyl-tRNA hydrolase [Carboxydocella sp. ULO1]|uniref:aminoacyl-tRNA hydrolase n=1 Tax=Carboxydocella sp. ULO1 TaxID=1926599 RepID=UPI0009AF1B94|nr:aminoacyl-tRNA hydrolase [Carboxydocella sp. ULO1]